MKKILYLVLIAVLAIVYACGSSKERTFDYLTVGATYDKVYRAVMAYEMAVVDLDSICYREVKHTYEGTDYVYGVFSVPIDHTPYYFVFQPDDKGTLRYTEYFSTEKFDPEKASSIVFSALSGGMTVNEYLAKEKAKEENETASQAELKAKYDAVSKADYPTDVDPFVTPDLKFCQVRGHVKEIKVEDTTIAQFDKNGALTMYLSVGDKHPRLKRNAQGQIVVLTYDRWGEHEKETEMTIKYDKNGYCSEWNDDWDGQRMFTFDDNGLLSSFEWIYKCTYRYTKFDDHGNYLEAIIKVDKDEDEVEYGKEERTIVYY